MPLDHKLEALAHRWCKSDSSRNREQGAGLLQHFDNEQNIKILKALLQDPEYTLETKFVRQPGTDNHEVLTRTRRYPVRRAAYDAWKHWESWPIRRCWKSRRPPQMNWHCFGGRVSSLFVTTGRLPSAC